MNNPRLGPLSLTLLLAAALLGFGAWKAASERAVTAPRIPVPIAGTRTLPEPLVVELLIDESTSTTQSDPRGLRRQEAVAIARWLARYSDNPRDRLGVIRFAGSAHSIDPLLADDAASHLSAELTRQPTLASGTNLSPAVELADAALAPYSERERKVVIIFSDFAVNENARQIRILMRKLRGASDALYIVALDADRTWTDNTRMLFDQVGATGIITLRRIQENGLAATVAEALLRETGQRVPR